MFHGLVSPLLLTLLLAMGLRPALNLRASRGGSQTPATIFDEIADVRERRAFREVWNTSEPSRQRDLAIRFVQQYPGSTLLREAYELAARASVAAGDLPAGLEWAKRCLRLMPENPSLLVMVADVAAKLHQPELAETSARDAIRHLTHADAPAAMPREQWTEVRNELRGTAMGVLGRVAAWRGQDKAAEQSLLAALSLNPRDLEALYILGVVRIAQHDDGNAAAPLAQVMRSRGPLSEPARTLLRQVFDRRPPSDTTFDDYAGSLKWIPPAPPSAAPVAAARARYAGSTACRDCHAAVYRKWQATGMAKMLQPYRAADIIGDFSGAQTVSGSARAVLDQGRHFLEIRKGASDEWIRYPVDYTIGSKWQQAYATRFPDNRLLVLPIQYSRLRAEWVNYWETVDARGSPRTAIDQFHRAPGDTVYQSTCAPCHTSQLRFENGGGAPGAATDSPDSTFREPGINCEMCHGPSLSHVEQKKGGDRSRRAASEPPLDFTRLAPEQSVAICAQCHAQSAIHAAGAGGAVNYSEESTWYRTYSTHLLTDFPRAAFFRDGRFRATTFISEAFARSQCFRKGGATCVSCHDPHPSDAAANPTSLKFSGDSNELCVQCHADFREAPARHTRHEPGTEASRCVSCHMPRIVDALLFKARSHQIDDVPDQAMTARFGNDGSPNACLSCHRDRDAAWLRLEMTRRSKKPL
jgi:predicted CXXCH cytochrome family protein